MEPALSLAPLPPPPPNEGGVGLPLNWKTAHDQTGLLNNICMRVMKTANTKSEFSCILLYM